MSDRLTRRRAFISGSSSGIGAATALQLAQMGAAVIVHGRDASRVDQVTANIRAAGGTADAVYGGLDTDAEAAAVVEQVEQVGKVDILVNAAGATATTTWATSDTAEFLSQYQTNTLAVVRMIRPFLPHMRTQRWGRIIQISSIAATHQHPDQVPGYAAAKAALLAMTTSLAMTVASEGVTVNSVQPGYVATPTLERYFLNMPDNAGKGWGEIEPTVAQLVGIPVGRLGRPEDIARLIGFLVSPASDWITGSNFRIDGGNLCSLI